jgi:hypothetical protein
MIDKLRAVFNYSFSSFLERETQNILNGTSERNLCACWAPLLEQAAIEGGFEGYRGDAEYNRMKNGMVKVILANNSSVVRIVCDLILHSRGSFMKHDNLIAIEMKRSNRPEPEKESDRLRLRTLTRSTFDGVWSADGVTHPRYVCGYQLGFYVEFDVTGRSLFVEEYVEGTKVDEHCQKF